MVKMTTEELAEYVLNHSLDEAISKCEEILKDYVDEVEDWEDEDQFRAIKDGYCIDNFKVATNNVVEAVAKIIDCAEKRNRQNTDQ